MAPGTARKARPRGWKGRSSRFTDRERVSWNIFLILLRVKFKLIWPFPFPVISTQKQDEESKAEGRLQKPREACPALCRPHGTLLFLQGPSECTGPTWPPSHHGPDARLHLRLNAHWGGLPHHREDRWRDFSAIYGTKGRLLISTLFSSAKSPPNRPPPPPPPLGSCSTCTRATVVTHRDSHLEIRYPESWLHSLQW